MTTPQDPDRPDPPPEQQPGAPPPPPDAEGVLDPEVIARWAASPWRGADHYDDLLQEARLACWAAQASWDPARAALVSWMQYRARHAVIDAARRWYGRSRRPDPVPLTEVDEPGVVDQHDLLADVEARLGDVEAKVWRGLRHGWRKSEIAEALGVHRSRVSQHVRRLRKHLDG